MRNPPIKLVTRVEAPVARGAGGGTTEGGGHDDLVLVPSGAPVHGAYVFNLADLSERYGIQPRGIRRSKDRMAWEIIPA